MCVVCVCVCVWGGGGGGGLGRGGGGCGGEVSLRKHAYSNILKISPPKPEGFQIKILIFFLFLLKT